MPIGKHRPDPQKSLVGFVVDDVHYAVPIAAVREIVNPLELTPLPHSPAAVAGVADHRGEVIPVVDLRVRFGLPRAADRRRSKWILVAVEGRTVGLIVDGVTEVFGTGGAELKPPPALGSGDDVRGIVGVTSHEDALVFVLDLARFEALVRPLAVAGLIGEKGALDPTR
jgi:purine-binding chemotaxis protein CheW